MYLIKMNISYFKNLKFNYKFVLPSDMKWGGRNPNTTTGWDGLVHDLLNRVSFNVFIMFGGVVMV